MIPGHFRLRRTLRQCDDPQHSCTHLDLEKTHLFYGASRTGSIVAIPLGRQAALPLPAPNGVSAFPDRVGDQAAVLGEREARFDESFRQSSGLGFGSSSIETATIPRPCAWSAG